MKNRLFLFALVFFLGIAPAFAGETLTINKDELDGIVTKLESGAGRKELASDLKTLAAEPAAAEKDKPAEEKAADGTTDAPKTEADAQANAAEAEKTIAPITQTLGVDSMTNHLIWKYQHFLIRNDLNSSTVGKIILTGILFLLGGLLIFITRRGATKMLYWFDRAVAWLDLPAARMRIYAKILRSIVTLLLLGLMVYTLTLIWDFGYEHNATIAYWFRSGMRTVVNVVFVVILAAAAWETLNALLAAAFKRADGANSTRAKTIIPIFRNILFLVFAIMFTMVLLSELGINIVPLLAGAGVVGIAVGFGAQTMVKDFLSGFTLILEDVMRVGDVVRINEFSGVVEKITMRKIQIRGSSGTVYTIPFSAVNIIQNQTKDFSFFDFTYTASFYADVDKIFATLREVAAGMQADPEFSESILEPIDIWGVDDLTESGMIIKGRIKTAPGQHWSVQREFHRRKLKAFDKVGLPNSAVPLSFQVNRPLEDNEPRPI